MVRTSIRFGRDEGMTEGRTDSHIGYGGFQLLGRGPGGQVRKAERGDEVQTKPSEREVGRAGHDSPGQKPIVERARTGRGKRAISSQHRQTLNAHWCGSQVPPFVDATREIWGRAGVNWCGAASVGSVDPGMSWTGYYVPYQSRRRSSAEKTKTWSWSVPTHWVRFTPECPPGLGGGALHLARPLELRGSSHLMVACTCGSEGYREFPAVFMQVVHGVDPRDVWP